MEKTEASTSPFTSIFWHFYLWFLLLTRITCIIMIPSSFSSFILSLEKVKSTVNIHKCQQMSKSQHLPPRQTGINVISQKSHPDLSAVCSPRYLLWSPSALFSWVGASSSSVDAWRHLMRCRTSEDSSVISPSLCRRQGSMSMMRSTIRTKPHMPIRAYAITHITGSLRNTPLVQSDATPSAKKGPAISANGTPPFSVGKIEEVFTKVTITKIGALITDLSNLNYLRATGQVVFTVKQWWTITNQYCS